jgi:multidrug efflux pump subunit AcrA (membrane-fusion protein)
VLVLEGHRVEAGQIVARMVDEDAKLAMDRAEAELAAKNAELLRAQADVEVAIARAAGVRDEVKRNASLVSSGAAAAGPVARLQFQLTAMEREVDAYRAASALASANVRRQEVVCNEARLTLRRMQIESPVSGVVLSRLIEPGSRISMASKNAVDMVGAIVRLYDPAKLQVRVDVSLADCAKIGVGTRAEIMTEALPDKTFQGEVTRAVHEANIQRNTVQFKVAIRNPVPTMKPEMLCRVRFFTPTTTQPSSPSMLGTHRSSSFQILAPRTAIINVTNERGQTWIVDRTNRSSGPVAELRDVTLAGGERNGLFEIANGLQPGDRLIVDPPAALKPGVRIRVLGEKSPASEKP